MKKRIGRMTLAAVLALVLLFQSGCGAAPANVPAPEEAPEETREETTASVLPTSWDLTELYADEAAFAADMKRGEDLLPEVEKLRGTLHTVEGILNWLENPDLLELAAICDRAALYSTLLLELDASDPWGNKSASQVQDLMQKASLAYAFVPAEIMEMPLAQRQALFADERLAPYAYYLRDYTDPDHTVLSEEAQQVAAIWSTANTAERIYEIFDHVDLPCPTITYPDGTEGVLTDDAIARINRDPAYSQSFRIETYKLRHAMREPYANTYAALLEGDMRAHWAQAQIEGFDSTLAAEMHTTDIDSEIFDRIIDFAHSLQPTFYQYYQAKKELLGLEEMWPCDLFLSITDYQPRAVTYDEAVATGREAISVWGEEYLEVFDRVVNSGHVDAYPSATKDTGAMSILDGNELAPTVVDYTPFVMYNFTGSEASDTSVIVHEMGHAVYDQLSVENQNVYNSCPTIFTHEVASTANELLLSKAKVAQSQTRAEKLFWLDQEITLFCGALQAQCQYSEFEDYCHKVIEGGAALDAGDMADQWLTLCREYYGDAVTIPESGGIGWAQIPHFYYSYYLYQYATSVTYATSVCQKVAEEGQEAVDDYMAFLKAGGSASPAELLRIAGVDPLQDETYETARRMITELVDEFVALAHEAA